MKKIFVIILLVFGISALSGCNGGPVLNILNWGEYINEDLIAEFEALYNVRVEIDPAESNEAMYTRINAGTTKYDIAVPSDYMIHKLYKENLLIELDFDKLPNYKSTYFDPNLEALRADYFENNQKYAVPYFWGTLGIMYNNKKPRIKELVEEYEWEVFFNKDVTGDAKVAMYNSSRDAIAAAELYLGMSLNTTSRNDLQTVENLLKQQNYFTWGTDNLKQMVADGNCDIALVYSGDFFDMLYGTLEEDGEVTYNMHVPNVNNIWFDGLVIPKTAKNVDLAHQFINFILDPDNAYENATEVGYCPTLTSAFVALSEDPDFTEVVTNYPFYPGNITNGEIYRDLGHEIYELMDTILSNAKS